MKFSQMPYARPNLPEVKQQLAGLTARLSAAEDYTAAREVFLEKEALENRLDTQLQLAKIRHSIDTRDEFYDGEMQFWNAAEPELEEYRQQWMAALLESTFRPEFAAEFGELMFTDAEIARKTFDPAMIPDMQQENELTRAYEKRIASAQIPFEGGIYTLSQLENFKNDPDDARRLAAWKAEGRWFKENQPELDEIYDKLVHLRDAMGRKLGYDGYTELGYYRMGRNCYTKEDVEQFRKAVVEYVVPVACEIYRRQAQRIGKSYPMSFADNQLAFRSGNPAPAGDADAIVAAAKKFYEELSPETGEFFNFMLENQLMHLLSTEGKEGGGYCTLIPAYGAPFIFANFNGTMGDIEVATHEAGHAFASYVNRSRIPASTVWPSKEGCEVHSMSMEFFGEGWAEDFFGKDARKFRYSHLAEAITFIPYGTAVDHFQHIIYEQPNLTPAERHAVWKDLLGLYMPWEKLDGDIPFYGEGESWQQKHHIYSFPFYYIDYCLAQTISLEFWAMIQQDMPAAWQKYMAYTLQGGSDTFTAMLQKAGLPSPFAPDSLREVCAKAERYLAAYDLTGLA